MKDKVIGIVITDGVGYRNFILSNFFEEVVKNYKQVIILSCLPKSIYGNLIEKCKIIEIDVLKESFYTWFFRKGKELNHLRLNLKDNFGIQDNFDLMYTKSKSIRGFSIRFLHILSKITASENIIHLFYSLQKKSFSNNKLIESYHKIIKENKISLLFFTHQRPPYIASLLYVSEKQNIPTSTFIFSWDNIASKGRMAGDFNYYFVLSNLMKKELLKFYSGINENQIKIVGTPQFEPYIMEKFGYSKNELIKKFDLKPEIPIIFFTCNDSSSENDPLYLDYLAESINANRLSSSVNLIVRTSPAEDPTRFENLKEKYEFIKWNFPDWELRQSGHQEPWTQRVPSHEDVSDLKSLLAHCDVCINVLSTITLDSFLFGKPVINPVFGNEKNEYFDDQKFLKYEHLQHLVNSNSSMIVKNQEEFINAVNLVLSNNDKKENERNEFVNLQIRLPLEGTSKRIVEVLKTL